MNSTNLLAPKYFTKGIFKSVYSNKKRDNLQNEEKKREKILCTF